MPKTFFITTAIYYTNSSPHVGHAYEMVLADVIARYHRLKGDKVFFLTGVDQHGQKVQQSAAKAGVPPAEFVKGISQKFVDLGRKLDVQYDDWAETTSERHKKVVRGILQRLFEEGKIYKDKQAGYYSVRQEQFLTDKERGPDGKFGPEWGEIEFREEENYYFKLNQYKDWLLSYLNNRKDGVIPDFRQRELRNAVERLTGDLCISRPKSRLDWGIELPFDKNFVTYVWFDALTNYISFAGYDPKIDNYENQPQDFRDRWENVLQIVGKDILVPAHGIYWLIMLRAMGFPDDQMPQLLVHGWWNLGGAKMSKSTGNIVDPFVLADKYSAETLRYYLMSDIATGKDADFSEERLIERYNADLANSLGNLLNRSLTMIDKYCVRKLTRPKSVESYPVEEFGLRVSPTLGIIEYVNAMTDNAPNVASHVALNLALQCNQIVDASRPWALAKDSAEREHLDQVLYTLAESLRIIAIWISPVLPRGAHGIFDQLNWKMELSGKEERFSLADAEWGRLPDGHVVGKPVPLFPRIEVDEGV
ncbi:MAG TPA: class I tRNA ligase family protein [Candidatus Udaeobacter sp.]|jgi:methionyl-tRNA synthetase|nr:class I tRNA ligase family protein [Candidatus Udaeobacter sp.]